MPKPRPDDFGTVAEVAAVLHVNVRSVQRYMQERGLKHFKVGTGQQAGVRIRWTDLERWLEKRAVERSG